MKEEGTMAEENNNGGGEAEASSADVMANISLYALLLEVINRDEDDVEQQQKNLEVLSEAMHPLTFPRRLFRVLFPSVETSRRVR
jgi:hypothetical protein